MKEKKVRIEDALSATRAAVEEGIISGGGTAFVNALPKVHAVIDSLTGDAKTGAMIVARALEEPIRQIVINAGHEGSVVLAKVLSSKKGVGYNVMTEKYEDMISSGIVDPTKVARTALQNAASVAALILTTESLVCDIPEKEEPMPQGGQGMGGYGM